MTSVQQLLEELGKRPEAKDLLKECGMKGTPQDYAEAVLSVAQRLGIETQVGCGSRYFATSRLYDVLVPFWAAVA